MEVKSYDFNTIVWKSEGPGGWYFASVPQPLSREIREIHQESEEGWGRLKSIAQINKTIWDTAVWFDTKLNCYLCPVKGEIRKKEGITDGSKVQILLKIEI